MELLKSYAVEERKCLNLLDLPTGRKLVSKKSNFHYTPGSTPKRVTTSGVRLRGLLALEQHRKVAAVASRW